MLAALRIHRQRFPSHRSKFVWITKTRTQRDDARIALRGLVRNPLRVSSIGRLAGVGPTEEEDSQFDELVEEELKKRMARWHEAENLLREEIETISAELNATSELGRKRIQLIEEYQRLMIGMKKEQQIILMDVWSEMDIVCMTADGFTQMKSGDSILSPLFESCDIPLGVIDEGLQINPNNIKAISCW